MVRATLQDAPRPDLAGPLDLGHAWRRVSSGAEVRPRFAVGAHAGSALRSRVEREEFPSLARLPWEPDQKEDRAAGTQAAEFGDMAILNMTDSFETAGLGCVWDRPVRTLRRRGCPFSAFGGWLSFPFPASWPPEAARDGRRGEKAWDPRWALQRYPDAQLIFHQDGDTVVDWRQALPRLLRAVLGPEVLSRPLEEEALQRLQLGRLCERTPTHLLAGCPGAVELEPCGAGSLYGFSGGGPPKSWGVRGSRATRLTSVGSPRS
ncbi:unnamed protein product [Effrenium voratum]|nr:unnamed protein product [Effrenium voratum]